MLAVSNKCDDEYGVCNSKQEWTERWAEVNSGVGSANSKPAHISEYAEDHADVVNRIVYRSGLKTVAYTSTQTA